MNYNDEEDRGLILAFCFLGLLWLAIVALIMAVVSKQEDPRSDPNISTQVSPSPLD